MHPYFDRTPLDAAFYESHLRGRMPARVFDVHVHVNLPEHVRGVPPRRILSDWAMECGHILPVEDALQCAAELFPGIRYQIAGFPFPIPGSGHRGQQPVPRGQGKAGPSDSVHVRQAGVGSRGS